MYEMTHKSRPFSGKKVVSLALCAAVTASAFAAVGMVSASGVSPVDYGLAQNIQEGTILHCFDWKYSDIKAELPAIAQAGFTSIQTSPVQPAGGQGSWYWLYQPLSFSVGTELGTKEELKDLCDTAEQYGIKVIVDVVANHLAGDHTSIQSDLQDEKYWHTLGEIQKYTDRKQVTDGDIGMQDLKTEDPYVQQVVANYINELKELGVDGIRWDAAKHISLPSEGSDFWKTVTASGLYNYGEILSSPVDNGGEDLMAEYTNYISVTDDTYGNSVRSSFAGGKAPTFDGNWTTEGISANKLVYWGESHDTYAGGIGEGSNSVSQNNVDRAYAVVAARSDASSLYLSRPQAKMRDSIRIGVKGSRQFASDEIAAVNHFHNAMIGKADAYGVTDNVAVVTRQNGGAVIVCGKGSGAVEVNNVNNYVPDGTYTDEVSGNVFTVSGSKITGTVGESGIAVIYNSAYTNRVSVDKVSGTKFNNTLKITLKAIGVTNAVYETSEGASGSFVNGDTIDIGAATEGGKAVNVFLKADSLDGKTSMVSMYTYSKNELKPYPVLNGGGVVFDNSETKWKKVNVFVYDKKTEKINNGSWPGVQMTDCGNNLYKYELPEQFSDCGTVRVIFNNGSGDQVPGLLQPGLPMEYTEKMLYNGTDWVDLPEVSVSPDPTVSEPSQESTPESSVEEPSTDPVSEEPSETSKTESSGAAEVVSTVSYPENSGNKPNSTVSTIPAGTTSTVTAVSTVSTASTVTSTTTSTTTTTTPATTTIKEVVATSDGTLLAVFALTLIGLVSGIAGFKAYKKKND